MFDKWYVGFFNFYSVNDSYVNEFFNEMLNDQERVRRNFAVVKAGSEVNAKRKIFDQYIGENIREYAMDIANYILFLYDNNINGTEMFYVLEKIYDKYIGDSNISDLNELSEDRVKEMLDDIRDLDKRILRDVVFSLVEDDIYLTDKFVNIE